MIALLALYGVVALGVCLALRSDSGNDWLFAVGVGLCWPLAAVIALLVAWEARGGQG